jgi:hypothetical protein
MSSHSHRSGPRSSVRGTPLSRGAAPASPSCPLSARPAQVDHPGSSPSWEELLGQR